MAIVNRDLDSSQQVVNFTSSFPVGFVGGGPCGLTNGVAVMPSPGQLVGAGLVCQGLSGAPNMSLWLNRFIVGTGFTAIPIGASLVAQALGTSGGQTFNVGAGVTWTLQAGDAIVLVANGANTAIQSATVTLSVKALQDIKTQFGASV